MVFLSYFTRVRVCVLLFIAVRSIERSNIPFVWFGLTLRVLGGVLVLRNLLKSEIMRERNLHSNELWWV